LFFVGQPAGLADPPSPWLPFHPPCIHKGHPFIRSRVRQSPPHTEQIFVVPTRLRRSQILHLFFQPETRTRPTWRAQRWKKHRRVRLRLFQPSHSIQALDMRRNRRCPIFRLIHAISAIVDDVASLLGRNNWPLQRFQVVVKTIRRIHCLLRPPNSRLLDPDSVHRQDVLTPIAARQLCQVWTCLSYRENCNILLGVRHVRLQI
jgi:hypothetical protein